MEEWAGGGGDVQVSRVYADWAVRKHAARHFMEAGFDTRMVLRKLTGGDRSDMALALDAHELLLTHQRLTRFAIAAGDSDYRELIRKIQERGKTVTCCALSLSASREILSAAPFQPLEQLLGGLVPTSESEEEERRLKSLVYLIAKFEAKLPFVGVAYLVDPLRVDWRFMDESDDQHARRRLMDRAEELRWIELYKEPNPKRPEYPVTAVRLNRSHPEVQEIIGKKQTTV